MYENVGTYYFLNNKSYLGHTFNLEDVPNHGIYEVVRVFNGKVLFFQDHMNRLSQAMENINIPILKLEVIKNNIHKLIEDHPGLNSNIKIDVGKEFSRVYFVKSYYPEEKLYQKGISTTLLDHDRKNPHFKIMDMDYKKKIEAIKKKGFFEVLLVNREDIITEGSRSNLIFIVNDTLIGAPLDLILHGVTFKNVLKMAKNFGFKYQETGLKVKDLNSVDACFITGTSLGVLPIDSIDDIHYKSSEHYIVKSLMKAYNEYIHSY